MYHMLLVNTIAMVSLKLRLPIKRDLRFLKMKTPYFRKGKMLKLAVI